MLEAHAECREETVRYAPLTFEKGAVVVSREAFTVLMLIAKAKYSAPVFEKLVVGLKVDRAARFVIREDHWIRPTEIENRLSGYAVSVRSADRDYIPEIIALKRHTGRGRVHVEEAKLRKRKLRHVAPLFRSLLLRHYTHVGVVIVLKRVIRNSVKGQRIRASESCGNVAHRRANFRRRVYLIAEVPVDRCVVEVAIGFASSSIKTRELGIVIESMKHPSQRDILAKRAKIAAVNGVVHFWNLGGAAGGSHIDHAGQRIAAIEHAICAAQNFQIGNPCVRLLSKIERSTNIIYRNSIYQNLVKVRGPSANK